MGVGAPPQEKWEWENQGRLRAVAYQMYQISDILACEKWEWVHHGWKNGLLMYFRTLHRLDIILMLVYAVWI